VLLAPINSTAIPTQSREPFDVVPTSRLLELAKDRFNVAFRIVGTGDTAYVPTTLATTTAIHEATNGVGALQSVLVPATPWGPRQMASSAMTQVKRALIQLEQYRNQIAAFGERSLERADLPVGTLALLDNARSSLRSAIIHLP
jgi:hypothetical protein